MKVIILQCFWYAYFQLEDLSYRFNSRDDNWKYKNPQKSRPSFKIKFVIYLKENSRKKKPKTRKMTQQNFNPTFICKHITDWPVLASHMTQHAVLTGTDLVTSVLERLALLVGDSIVDTETYKTKRGESQIRPSSLFVQYLAEINFSTN